MSLPDFIVIGAAKSGTTSLYALLDQHDDIFMPVIKEPEFFARDDLYNGGLAAYEATYDAAKPGQRIGEASTLYTLSPLFPKTAARIAKHCPKAQLIFIMRQPVDRAYSFYIQLIKNYQNTTKDYAVHRTFEEFIDPNRGPSVAGADKVISPVNAHLPDVSELCLAGSDYVQQIEAYLEHFDRSQMLFLKFEDFVADRQKTTNAITDFLGLDPLPAAVFDRPASTRNISKDHFDQLDEAASLSSLKDRAGPLWSLRKLLPQALRDRLRGRVASGAVRAHVPAPMTDETRAALSARFLPQLDRLSELTGLNFDDWKGAK